MKAFWPEAKERIHVDAWKEITKVDGFSVKVLPIRENVNSDFIPFFINPGGYKENEFQLSITASNSLEQDTNHIGYLKINSKFFPKKTVSCNTDGFIQKILSTC